MLLHGHIFLSLLTPIVKGSIFINDYMFLISNVLYFCDCIHDFIQTSKTHPVKSFLFCMFFNQLFPMSEQENKEHVPETLDLCPQSERILHVVWF